MTREEAIEEIKRWTPILLFSGQCTEKTSEAQDMAISALSENKGEWIPKERTTECSTDIDIVCSKCGYVGIESYSHGYELNEIDMQEARNYIKKFDMNFCTCCGADMRKGEE